jgi:RNAse (barnase) inhibitor barstar
MATFTKDIEVFQRLDYALLQNSAISMYYRTEILNADIDWLKNHGYQIDSFDCSLWYTEEEMHIPLARQLNFPDYYGHNLNALNDCLSDIEISSKGGRVLVFNRYDVFAQHQTETAWYVLDIIANNSRQALLFGEHFFVLLQSADPAIHFESVGACPVMWNRKEWLNKNRGL